MILIFKKSVDEAGNVGYSFHEEYLGSDVISHLQGLNSSEDKEEFVAEEKNGPFSVLIKLEGQGV
jgi:hypothetical protein